MTKYLHTKPGSIEELAAKMTSQVSESDYQQKFKKELEKAGKGIGAMTPAEKKAFFSKIDKQHKAKDEEIKESVNEKKNYKYNRNFFVNDKTDTLKKMTGRQGYNKSTLTDYLAQKSNKKEDDVYFDDTDLVFKDKTVLKNAETKTVDQMLKALQKESVDNPYAVGMAQAMKKTGDKPPLKKSTITKAHDIAKSIEKDQKEEVEEAKVDELTAAQKKLPPALQKAIKKKEDAKEEVKEARWEIEGRVAYKGVGPEDSFHMVIDAPTKDAAERKAYDELDKARQRRKIGPGGGGGIEEADIEYIERTNDRLSPPEAGFMGNSYDPTQKEEVEETHSFVTNKQNQKQKDAKGEKEIVDPEPKIKKPSMNEQTAKQHSLMKAIYDVWSNSATELEEVKHKSKYMKASKDDVSTETDAEQKEKKSVEEANIDVDNVKKGDTEKEKELKIKLDKEKDADHLEKQLIAAQGQINILKQKLENEKNKAVKPEPNPETGEVPLTVGVAYKIMKDKMKKESDEKEQKKNKTMTDKAKTPVDTKPEVDYKN